MERPFNVIDREFVVGPTAAELARGSNQICHDCGKPIGDAERAKVQRCTGGPSHNESGGYVYSTVTVHADRRLCGDRAQ